MSGPAPSIQYAWDGPGANGAGQDAQALLWNQATGKFVMGAAGVSDHGGLSGLADDDHTQYLLVSGTRAMTGPLLVPSGAVGAPAVSFSGETNTGFYKAAAGTVRYSGGGVGSVQFDGTGLDIISGHLRGQGGYFDVTAGAGIIVAHGAAVVPWTVQGASAQTANLTNWKNSAGTVLAKVAADGALTITSGNLTLSGGSVLAARVYAQGSSLRLQGDSSPNGWVQAAAAGHTAFLVKEYASQTADPFQVQNSAAAVQFAIGAAGKILTNQAVANTNTPSGATSKAMPIYDAAGTLLGYMPVYASTW